MTQTAAARPKAARTIQRITAIRKFGSADQIEAGSVLIGPGTPLPEGTLSVMRVTGWRLIEELNAYDFDRQLRRKGCSFFFLPPRVEVSAFAMSPWAALKNALRKIYRWIRRRGLNALETATIRRRRILGVYQVRLTAHPHHLHKGPYLCDLDPHSQVKGAWDFKRIHKAQSRQTAHLKAI